MSDPMTAAVIASAGAGLVGGVAQGVGQGESEEANRQFTAGENALDRIFTGQENAQDRKLQMWLAEQGFDQAALDRDFAGDQAAFDRALQARLQEAAITGDQQSQLIAGQLQERLSGIQNQFQGGQNELDRMFNERQGALDKDFQSQILAGQGKQGAQRASTLNSLIESEILNSNTAGLESAAARTLTQGGRSLDAALGNRGLFDSGLALQGQTELAGGVLSSLARDINADQLSRAGLASQLFSDSAFGFFDPATGQAVNQGGPNVNVPEFSTQPGFDGGPIADRPGLPTPVSRGPLDPDNFGGSSGGPTTSPVDPFGPPGPTPTFDPTFNPKPFRPKAAAPSGGK